MARKLTPAQMAARPAKNTGLKMPGKPKQTHAGTGAAPRRRTAAKKPSARNKSAAPLNTTILDKTPAGKTARQQPHKYNFRGNAVSLGQVIGIGLAGLAFFGLVGGVIRHAYNNRPSHAQAVAQASELENATASCGKKPYLVITTSDNYNKQRQDYYTPGFEDYETRAKQPPSSDAETKRFDCTLDGALIAYATPHYSAGERAEVAGLYMNYAAAKGVRFIAPSYTPPGFALHRQTLSSTSYSVSFSPAGAEAAEGYHTTCSLLRDAADRLAVTTYRTADKILQKKGAITIYGDIAVDAGNTEQPPAYFSETGDMWCSFTQTGERLLENSEILTIMGSLADQKAEVVLQASPVATK